MKIRNPAPLRPERQIRGISSGLRAGVRGITVRDSLTDVHPTLDIKFVGATVTELDDDTAVVTIGGAGSGTPGTGGDPTEPSGVLFSMLNNSGQDLSRGDVVVVDETADRAVTVTTTEGDLRIAGVVQEPIADGASGLVLFNGYTPIINASGVTRGEYAQTATSAAQATSTADREAGSFAVYLTGDTIAEDFAVASATTTSDVPVVSLAIDMPSLLPTDRVLFLALWLEDGTSAVSVAGGWTLIGSTAGFYYYRRVATGDDTATATWTTASTAVATVLLLHESVSLSVPIEDFDYDATTAAASVSGLSDVPRYAIAGVRADVASPGSGFVRLGGDAAGFTAGGTLSIVQEKGGDGSTGVTFDAPVTPGNLLIAVPTALNGDGVGSHMVTLSGATFVPDTTWTDVAMDGNTESVGNSNYVSIQAKIATSSSAGPFYDNAAGTAGAGALYLYEVEGVGVAGFEAFVDSGLGATSPTNIGTFASVGTNDLVIMAAVNKNIGAFLIAATGYTTDYYDTQTGGFHYIFIGHQQGSGGAIDAEFTHGTPTELGVVAAHFTSGTQSVAGTLAGKYIGHASSATSPFSGGGQADDAIFAINLLGDAKPSALLYGPDLGGGGGSEPTADAHIADTSDAHDASAISIADAGTYFTATDAEAALAELAAKDIGYQAHGTMGATETFSALTGWHSGTFNADCTFTFSGATSGIVASMVLELTEDGTGTWTPTWPGSVVWPGGTPPTHDETAGTTTIYLFQSRDGGTTWYGFQAGGSTVAALDDLSDVTLTSPAEDDQLQYVSGQWVNNARRWEPVTFDPGTGPEIVFTATDIVMTWETY